MVDEVERSDLLIDGVSKSFRDPKGAEVKALAHVNLKIPSGEFIVLLGPSGCVIYLVITWACCSSLWQLHT